MFFYFIAILPGLKPQISAIFMMMHIPKNLQNLFLPLIKINFKNYYFKHFPPHLKDCLYYSFIIQNFR